MVERIERPTISRVGRLRDSGITGSGINGSSSVQVKPNQWLENRYLLVVMLVAWYPSVVALISCQECDVMCHKLASVLIWPQMLLGHRGTIKNLLRLIQSCTVCLLSKGKYNKIIVIIYLPLLSRISFHLNSLLLRYSKWKQAKLVRATMPKLFFTR